MLKKIRKIFYTITKIYNLNNRLLIEEKHSQGFSVLFSNIKFEKIYVPHSSYSLNSETIVDVLNDIVLNKRKSIVEFGTGVLTLYIAKLIKTKKLDVNFISFESDKNWIKLINSLLEKEGLKEFVTLKHIEIINIDKHNYKDQNKWYDFKEVVKIIEETKTKIDLVVVDAPYGQICKYVRYSAIPIIKQYLGEEYTIYLDDTNREVEREIFREWENLLGLKGEDFGTYSKINKGSFYKTHL